MQPDAPLDGGVPARLQRRSRIIGGVIMALAVAGATLGILFVLPERPTAFGLVIALCVLVALGAVRFFRAAGAWGRAGLLPTAESGARGLIGPCRPLHTVRARQPVKRRYPTSVVAIRTAGGALDSGTGLLVHGRRDKVALAEHDEVMVWEVRPRPTGRRDSAKNDQATSVNGTNRPPNGTFLIVRDSDGAVFAGGTNPLSAL